MNFNEWLQTIIFFVFLLALVKPLGSFMARVYQGERTLLPPVLGPCKNLLYRILMCIPFQKSLQNLCVLLIILLISGCSSPLPNLHSKDFAEFHQNRDNSEAKNIDKEWDRFAGVPIELKEDEFWGMTVKSSLPVLVEFYVAWCEYCDKFMPTLMELAKKYKGRVRFATIDCEQNGNLTSKMGVTVFPTFYLIKDGNVLDRYYGARGDTIEKGLKSKIILE